MVYSELPEHRVKSIMRTYSKAEFDRLDKAVYSVVEGRHPEYKQFFEDFRKADHNITDLFNIETDIMATQTVINLSGMFGKPMPNADKMHAKLRNFYELIQGHKHARRKFCVGLAHAVLEVSKSNRIDIEKVVTDLSYLDEATRTVFPTRPEAEDYLAKDMSFDRGMYENTVELNNLRTNKILLLSKDAMDETDALTKEYKKSEFDRVYAEL